RGRSGQRSRVRQGRLSLSLKRGALEVRPTREPSTNNSADEPTILNNNCIGRSNRGRKQYKRDGSDGKTSAEGVRDVATCCPPDTHKMPPRRISGKRTIHARVMRAR